MTGLRWYEVVRHGEFKHYVLADGYTADEDWVTFTTADGLVVASIPTDQVAIITDVAALLTDPRPLRASDAARKTRQKEESA